MRQLITRRRGLVEYVKGIVFTVRWIKARRTNKGKLQMTEKKTYLTQGNDKADKLAKLGERTEMVRYMQKL